MKPYTLVTGRVAPLPRSDIDTDQIIPARHLSRIERSGYGQFLFEGWRISESGDPDPTFVLNDQRFRRATVLATGPNFGCGSSREHAVWALLDYGFRTVIASSFADIFRNNCYQNGVLPVALPDSAVRRIMTRAASDGTYQVTVDLHACRVTDTVDLAEGFHVDPFRRECLLAGADDIDITLRHVTAIEAYERDHGLANCAAPLEDT